MYSALSGCYLLINDGWHRTAYVASAQLMSYPVLFDVCVIFVHMAQVCLSHALHFCPLIIFLLTHSIWPNVCSPLFGACLSWLWAALFFVPAKYAC